MRGDLPLPEESPEQAAARALGESIRRDAGPEALRDGWERAAAHGLFELLIPAGPLAAERAAGTLEGLGQGCRNGGFLLALGAHCFGVGAPLARFGGPPHAGVLDAMRRGQAVAALAASEAGAGSDTAAVETRWRESAGGYRLDGEKRFVTNVREADHFLVLASEDPALGFLGLSAFLVPRGAAGLSVGEDEPRLGLHGCSLGALRLAGVEVDRNALVGRRGGGGAVFQQAMLWERSLIVAAQVGVLRRQLLEALAQARGRRQFGRPIGTHQFVAGRVVDLLLRYTTSRLLVRDAAGKLERGTLTPAEASLVKLYVSEAALASSCDAVRLHGGAGYLASTQEADLRDALGGVIYSGTSDLQRVAVAAELGLDTIGPTGPRRPAARPA